MNATQNDLAATVGEIVREIFGALETWGSTEEGGTGSQREAAEADLKSLTPQEMAKQFFLAGRILGSISEALESPVPLECRAALQTALGDCWNRVAAARMKAEEAAQGGRIEELLLRADALDYACVAVEDWSANPQVRDEVLGVLRSLRGEAHKASERYQEEHGT
jgi:hypothetical protein